MRRTFKPVRLVETGEPLCKDGRTPFLVTFLGVRIATVHMHNDPDGIKKAEKAYTRRIIDGIAELMADVLWW